MGSRSQIHPRTGLFARVLGPYLVVAAVSMVTRSSDMRALLTQFQADAVWPWVSGAFVLLMGLTVIVLHPYWRGVAASVVSLLGWLTVIKGVALMTFPHAYLSFGSDAVAAVPWWQLSMVIVALVGLYLCFVGWVPAARRSVSRGVARPRRDVPHAA